MGNLLVHFCAKPERRGRGGQPFFDGFGHGVMVMATVYFGGVEMLRVKGQKIGAGQVFGVKNAFPAVAPATGANV